MSIVTLMTDYGTRDAYVASVKGVILSLAPQAVVVDLTHEIDPFDVRRGAFVLWQSFRWFPAGTVHLAVVDPGVGSPRKLLAASFAGHVFLVPDNGLLTLIHREFRVEAMHAIENRRWYQPHVSTTFHGRDILAPVAAHLVNGVRLWELGPATDRMEVLPFRFRADSKEAGLEGDVLCADRFGNLITNIHGDQVDGLRVRGRCPQVYVGSQCVGPLRAAYHEVVPHEWVAYIGGGGLLEIAIHRGRAVDRFGSLETTIVAVR